MSDAPPHPLFTRAVTDPGRLALRCGRLELTWAELAGRARGAAAALARLGVGAADRVALLAGNGEPWVTAAYGTFARAAVLVPLPAALPGEALVPLARQSRARLVLHDAAHAEKARSTGLATAPVEALAAAEGCGAAAAAPAAAPATILFTSGTTGTPRAALLTYGNHTASASASAAHLGTGPADTWLVCLPLFHVGGLALLFRAPRDGSALEIHERFDAAAVAVALAGGRVTCASLVARTLERTLAAAAQPFSGALRAVLVGGGPVPAPLLARARAAGLPVARTYGLTEAASQVATQRPGEADETCGRPLPGAEVRIEAGEDGAGEVCVRGPMVMAGYDGEPERSPGDWLRTGDIGRIDAAGRLVILDRRTDLVVSGGENVYPARVEAVLAGHPAVEEACVVGVPDPSWGHRVCAVLRLRGTVPEAELADYCRTRLGPHELPRIWIRADAELPRTPGGKVKRAEVRAWAARRWGGGRQSQSGGDTGGA